MASIDDAQAQALLALHPWPGAPSEERLRTALQGLIDAELRRTGQPDPVSGALHKLALTQGTLLVSEYDLATHGHWDAWEIGALIVDVRMLIRVNMELGFPAGDQVLRQVAGTLQALHPSARVVRIHSDAFAALFPPSSGEQVSEAMRDAARTRLIADVRARLGPEGAGLDVAFTVALLRLRIARPSHPQVLGPLVWAEAERALAIERRDPTGLQDRRLDLEGPLPPAT